MNESEFNRLLLSVKTSERSLTKLHDFFFGRIVYHLEKKYGHSFAEDVAQDFFLQLLRTESFPRVRFPTTWVYLQCDSIAKRKVQKEARYVHGEFEYEQKTERPSEGYGDVYEALQCLSETDRRIVTMHYWEGYSFKEIAPMLGLEYSAVRQRHKRLLAKLKKMLKGKI